MQPVVQDRFGKAQTLSNRADARGFEQVLKIGRATDEGAIRSDWQTRKKAVFPSFFFVYIILVLTRGGTDLKLKVLVAFSANFEEEKYDIMANASPFF